MASVLIIERNEEFRVKLHRLLRQESFLVLEAEDPAMALRLLSGHRIGVVVLGLEGFRREGLEVLRSISAADPGLPVITLSGPESVDLSIGAMRLGAFEDLRLPLSLEALVAGIRKACTERNASIPEGGEEKG